MEGTNGNEDTAFKKTKYTKQNIVEIYLFVGVVLPNHRRLLY